MKGKIKKIRQVSFVVPDIEKTLNFYSEILGFDQWERVFVDEAALKHYPHLTHGKEIVGTFKVAKGMVCNIEFEFMQPVSGDSIYMESLRERNFKPHMHHLYVEVDDVEEVFAEMGSKYEKIQEANTPFNSKVIYFDCQEDFGFIMETGFKLDK